VGLAINADNTVSNSAGATGTWTATKNAYGTYDVVVTAYLQDSFNNTKAAIADGTYMIAVVNGSTVDVENAKIVTLG
ncbi:MAG: hypothetical protein IJC15_07215, partial [Clostridia bacterium]|nr:hypothetical protein [Clostridia bacterium]